MTALFLVLGVEAYKAVGTCPPLAAVGCVIVAVWSRQARCWSSASACSPSC